MRIGSLFSGIGGFDLAFERVGFDCAWQVEIDKHCQNVLTRHFPNTERFEDVRAVGKHNLETVDVITGGFPCQDLSIAGKRAGLDGKRSGLWFEFARIIDELKPEWVVIENVPGLLSSNRGRDFGVILDQMVKFGYGVAWRVLDAQYFGVAQRRRRVFIVGHLGDGRAAEVLFEREGSPGDTAPSREKGAGVANDAPTSTLRGFGHGWQGQHNDTNPVIVAHAISASKSATGRLDPNEQDFVVVDGRNLNDQNEISSTLQSNKKGYSPNYHPIIAWHNKQQSGEVRIQGDTVNAVTQQWGTGGNNVPFVGVRRLTPTECERLQGFPDGWTDGQSDSARYRQLGNAVAVPVVEWIAERIMCANF